MNEIVHRLLFPRLLSAIGKGVSSRPKATGQAAPQGSRDESEGSQICTSDPVQRIDGQGKPGTHSTMTQSLRKCGSGCPQAPPSSAASGDPPMLYAITGLANRRSSAMFLWSRPLPALDSGPCQQPVDRQAPGTFLMRDRLFRFWGNGISGQQSVRPGRRVRGQSDGQSSCINRKDSSRVHPIASLRISVSGVSYSDMTPEQFPLSCAYFSSAVGEFPPAAPEQLAGERTTQLAASGGANPNRTSRGHRRPARNYPLGQILGGTPHGRRRSWSVGSRHSD